ncbi:MAG: tRNA (adenosine(37)-N6)-threonylcarbamoyltransferase complex dimerization subunit type 1 TsaB [Silicimonas sp.]|nr:tRNA (adenosine(37)-N6)-threonylcarbamoyltransferase complex dimerization subunit type 1 TsaB [Silicimonas sp.]
MPPETTILAFDTLAAHCAAALLDGDRILAEAHEDMARGQAERLFPLLEEVLTKGGKGWSDLDALGVGIGPGNFTGIRISVSAARGLALSLGIPAVGVSGLEAQVFGIDRPVLSALPAPKGAVYAQRFDDDDSAPSMGLPGDIALTAPRAVGIDAMGGALTPPAPLAPAIARLAATRYLDSPPRPAPLYIRPADAAPRRDPPVPILS